MLLVSSPVAQITGAWFRARELPHRHRVGKDSNVVVEGLVDTSPHTPCGRPCAAAHRVRGQERESGGLRARPRTVPTSSMRPNFTQAILEEYEPATAPPPPPAVVRRLNLDCELKAAIGNRRSAALVIYFP